MKLFLLGCLIALSTICRAQNKFVVESIPDQLKNRAAMTVRYESEEVIMYAPDDVRHKVKKAITIHNKNGEFFAYIPLYYDKSSKIKTAKGAVYDEFGRQIKKLSLKDFNDVSAADGFSMFSDTRLKYYSNDAPQYPYTLEFEYEIQLSQNLMIPNWSPDYHPQVSVEQSSYSFTYPTLEKIRIHTQNIESTGLKTEKEGFTTLKWEVTNLEAKKQEEFTHHFQDLNIQVNIVPERISYYNHSGSLTDWKNFGKWAHDMLLNGKQDLGPDVKQKVLDLTKNALSDKEKAKILYKYMQNKTRYVSIQVGIGGIEPFPASDVEKYGYGDCKALVNYMQNLLSFADIPSYYCVVEAGWQKKSLRSSFANMQDGNHVILCIPFENDTTWLECTSQLMPFGSLGDFTDDRLVLAWTAEGGQILKTPTYTERDNRQIRHSTLKLVDHKHFEGKMVTKFYGTQLDNHLDVLRANPTDKAKLLAKHYDINNISFAAIDYQMIEQDSSYVQENLNFSIQHIARTTNSKLIIPTTPFSSYVNLQRNDNRQRNVYINRGFTDKDILEIELPEDVNKVMTPINKSYECPMGTFEFIARIENDKLICLRTLTIKQGEYNADQYNVFQDFLKSVGQTDRSRISLELIQ